MSLLDLLYNFFQDNIFSTDYFFLHDSTITIGGYSMELFEWFCWTGAIVSAIVILALCCMFIYKIVKLIGGLIR